MRTYTVTVTRVVGLARNREGVGHEWLARFARTVGTQVVNVVGERFVAPRRPGLAGQVAGHDLSRLVRASVQPDDAPETRVRPGAGLAEYAPGRSNSRLLTARDFLSGTSFTLTMGQEDGLSAALWGRGAVMRFDGRDGDLLLNGEVSTGMLGVDYKRGAVTGGYCWGLTAVKAISSRRRARVNSIPCSWVCIPTPGSRSANGSRPGACSGTAGAT